MGIKGGERKVPVPIGRISQLCRLRTYLTARSVYAMATRHAANFTPQSLASNLRVSLLPIYKFVVHQFYIAHLLQ